MEHPFFINANSNRAEALRWISIAEKLLNTHDLLGCRSFATRARDSDPTLLQADQIIAIADTLLAGEKRINNQHFDWYAILQVPHNQRHDSEFIANQYHRLALLLNPKKNNLSFADQALRLVVDAWSLLSNRFRKNLYDEEIGFLLTPNQEPAPSAPNVVSPVQQQPSGFNVFPNSSREQDQMLFASREQQPISSGQSVAFLTRDQVPPVTSMQQQQSQPALFLNQDQPQPVTVTSAPAAKRDPQPQETYMDRKPHIFSFESSPGRVEQPPLASVHSPTTDHQMNKQPQQENEDSAGDNHNAPGNSIDDANKAEEKETRVEEPKSDIPSFWTACPYCYNMFEYPDAYVDCTLRCPNCKMAYQAIAISSPPPIINGKEAYFCCWGFIPLGFSVADWERNRDRATTWSPFSPMFTCPLDGGRNGVSGKSANYAATGQKSGNNSGGFHGSEASKGGVGHKNVTPTIHDDAGADDDGHNNATPMIHDDAGADDDGHKNVTPMIHDDAGADDDGHKNVTPTIHDDAGAADDGHKNVTPMIHDDDGDGAAADALIESSDSDEESDEDWHEDMKRKKSKSVKGKRVKKITPNRSAQKQQADKGMNAKGTAGGLQIQGDGRVTAEASKKGVVGNTRRQFGRIAKDYGKLDLNVEFSNEVEENPPGVVGGRGAGSGRREDDNIEGIGFFEGLDEFLSSLPILNVVGEDKVKAA